MIARFSNKLLRMFLILTVFWLPVSFSFVHSPCKPDIMPCCLNSNTGSDSCCSVSNTNTLQSGFSKEPCCPCSFPKMIDWQTVDELTQNIKIFIKSFKSVDYQNSVNTLSVRPLRDYTRSSEGIPKFLLNTNRLAFTHKLNI